MTSIGRLTLELEQDEPSGAFVGRWPRAHLSAQGEDEAEAVEAVCSALMLAIDQRRGRGKAPLPTAWLEPTPEPFTGADEHAQSGGLAFGEGDRGAYFTAEAATAALRCLGAVRAALAERGPSLEHDLLARLRVVEDTLALAREGHVVNLQPFAACRAR